MKHDSLSRSKWFAIFLAGMSALVFALSSCRGGYFGEAETITIGVPSLEQNALIYIAEQQGFFAQHDLKVVVKDYDSGVATIEALLKGEVDLAEASEFPFVGAALRQEQINIIATNDKFENDYLVARPDRGIEKLADLRGKRIGVARQTITEFFLGRLLDLAGIKPEEVTLVDVKPAQFVDAMVSGDVDALIAWQPYVHRIQKQVTGAVVLPAQSNRSVYGVLMATSEWLRQHPHLVVNFLKSLRAAEDYVVLRPEQAKAAVQKRLGYEDVYMASVWTEHHFALSLDHSLIVAMTDEARWMIKNKLTTAQQSPDFLNSVYVDGLKMVKPEAVDITR